MSATATATTTMQIRKPSKAWLSSPDPQAYRRASAKRSRHSDALSAYFSDGTNALLDQRALDKLLREHVSKSSEINKVRQLVGCGANVNSQDSFGRTPLHFAACRGSSKIVRFLLAKEADPNLVDKNGNTPLHLLACTSNTVIVKMLLDAGSDVTLKDSFGKTPLHWAQSRISHLCDLAAAFRKGELSLRASAVLRMIKIFGEKLASGGDKELLHLSEMFSNLGTVDTLDKLSQTLSEKLAIESS